MNIAVYDMSGKQVGSYEIDPAEIAPRVSKQLLHDAVVMYQANQRQGTQKTKTRGEVAGSTRKLYKQKGTGNARVGASRVPNRKGGGVTFAKTRTREDFRTDLTKKMRRLANRNALLAKLVDNEVKCIDTLSYGEPSTKNFAGLLKKVGVDRTCLVAVAPANRNAMLSARNIEGVGVRRIEQLSAFDLLNHRYLVVDKASLASFIDGSCFPVVEKKDA